MEFLSIVVTGTKTETQMLAIECLCNLSLGPEISCEKIAQKTGTYLHTFLQSSNESLVVSINGNCLLFSIFKFQNDWNIYLILTENIVVVLNKFDCGGKKTVEYTAEPRVDQGIDKCHSLKPQAKFERWIVRRNWNDFRSWRHSKVKLPFEAEQFKNILITTIIYLKIPFTGLQISKLCLNGFKAKPHHWI